MENLINILIGVVVLILGYPLGNFLALRTKEELKSGQVYFKILTISGLVGGFVGLIISNDVMMFSLFFIAIISSKSLKK